MTLREMLNQVRAAVDNIAGSGFDIYSERLPDTDDAKDGAVYVNDSAPWVITDKTYQINITLILRFQLDRFVEEGVEYYESDAQGEAFDILSRLVGRNISPGLNLNFVNTSCFADEKGRYIVRSELQGYKGG